MYKTVIWPVVVYGCEAWPLKLREERRLTGYFNYVREEGRLEKSLHTLTLGGRQIHSYVIFSKSIFHIRNRAVKWFGRDHISFASGR